MNPESPVGISNSARKGTPSERGSFVVNIAQKKEVTGQLDELLPGALAVS